MRRHWWLGLAAVSMLTAACDDDEGTQTLPAREAGLADMQVPDEGPADQAPPDQSPIDQAVDAAPDAAPDAQADAAVDMGAPVPACSNGVDDDGDEATDYPLDPGCSDPADDDEQDPAVAACANGEDDDGDGRTDHPEDPGCADPADPSEASACGDTPHDVIDLTATGVYEGTTEGNPVAFEACRTNLAPEAVFRFTLRTPVERLVASSAGTGFDTLVSIRRDCTDDASEVACNDDVGPGDRTSRAVVEQPALGDYYIILDGFLEQQGAYRLEVRAELPDGNRCDAEAGGPVTCGVGRVCAEGFCTRSLCANTIDDDGDGRFDYPDDPGCDSVDDDDETSPDPLPECANGIDDDFDGLVDFPDDDNCEDAADDEEARPPQCRDGQDNDRDGLIDLADPGCDGPDDGSEFNLEACRDGQDNDGDGISDFPEDPGCEDRLDMDETDPDPLPQCSNGEDDDEDGNIDYPLDADSCFFAADDTEDDPCARREPTEITGLRDVRGNTNEAQDDFRATCSPFGDAESLLLWRVAEDRPLAGITFSTRGTNFDTVVYVRDACDGVELGCDDDSGPDFGTSFLALGPQAPGAELFIFVDAGFTGSGGIWRLRVVPQLAEGANCGAPGTWTCAEGLECQEDGEGSTCQRTVCANGVDDDEDGLADWPLDPGCETPTDGDEADPAEVPACFNGVDDDEDGLVDFDPEGGGDPGCSANADDFEGPDCSDGIDNNGNGAADYDRDGNGVRDANSDRGCACANDPSEDVQPQCNDGCDNDRDGVIDLEDPGCMDAEDDNEFHFPECIDGQDNDGDGRADYPNDPGCTSEDDPVERAPAEVPACADGVDNDEDGRIDFAADGTGDDGCLAAADDDEAGPCDGELPELPGEGVAEGTTSGRLNEHEGTCIVGDAPDAAWRANLPYPAFVRANTFGSGYDTALYARSTCAPTTFCPVPDPEDPDAEPCEPESTELACNDDSDGLQSEVLFDWPGGELFLFVDGFGDVFGDYRLTVTALYPLGGQCGPDGPAWATCELGTVCQDDAEAGFPTCQAGE